jgi:hypothetical protein
MSIDKQQNFMNSIVLAVQDPMSSKDNEDILHVYSMFLSKEQIVGIEACQNPKEEMTKK